MHEYSIAYDIYATARKAALDNNAVVVRTINVDVGELAMVNPEQVIFLFQAISEEDPLFRDTELVCRTVPTRTKCKCGYEGGEKFVCPDCGGLPEIVSGREILVTNLEIEDGEE